MQDEAGLSMMISKVKKLRMIWRNAAQKIGEIMYKAQAESQKGAEQTWRRWSEIERARWICFRSRSDTLSNSLQNAYKFFSTQPFLEAKAYEMRNKSKNYTNIPSYLPIH